MSRDSRIDYAVRRIDFEKEHGSTPEAWLTQWRTGKIRDTRDNTWTYHTAMSLESTPEDLAHVFNRKTRKALEARGIKLPASELQKKVVPSDA